jgi:hypothetical protein
MSNDDRHGPRCGPLVGAALLVASALTVGACAEHFEAGLANAPSLERQNRPTRQHDAIANADDSCPRTPGAFDPVPGRAPPCVDTFDDAGAPPPDGGAWFDGAVMAPATR